MYGFENMQLIKQSAYAVGGVVLTGFTRSEFDASTDRNTVYLPVFKKT